MLVGNQVPYHNHHPASAAERQALKMHRERFIIEARAGLDVKQTLAYIRHPTWRWHGES
jgi:tryptophan 7-halogenase